MTQDELCRSLGVVPGNTNDLKISQSRKVMGMVITIAYTLVFQGTRSITPSDQSGNRGTTERTKGCHMNPVFLAQLYQPLLRPMRVAFDLVDDGLDPCCLEQSLDLRR